MILLYLMLAVVFEAVSHGMKNWIHRKNDNVKISKRYLKLWKPANVLFMTGLIMFVHGASISFDLTNTLLYYFAMRFCLFDYVHNYFFKENILYVGSVAVMDKIARFFPVSFVLILRIFILTIVIIGLIQEYWIVW